jgi:hypothetical protein
VHVHLVDDVARDLRAHLIVDRDLHPRRGCFGLTDDEGHLDDGAEC